MPISSTFDRVFFLTLMSLLDKKTWKGQGFFNKKYQFFRKSLFKDTMAYTSTWLGYRAFPSPCLFMILKSKNLCVALKKTWFQIVNVDFQVRLIIEVVISEDPYSCQQCVILKLVRVTSERVVHYCRYISPLIQITWWKYQNIH